ncbi:ABC transporter permease [Lacrimispora celerecrescens]|uniref:ABC-2 family transporter n=1 Tax=[Clostridium] celerecrescens 18A TaxID=1286362 RepID=A0A2M8Z8P2_9FIRM|nr:ABC transporter permease subunit [Lacrimispora celerecrescens]PJJ29813.1 ABC-2 family transporter [[Clostridium] celerecrescens 18A]
MKLNPVYKRETTVSSRSFRLALILALFNTILALVVLLNMYSVVERVKLTAEIQYSSFTNLYIFVAAVEFVMLMFIMPALTAGSISGERERQTLDLLLTTTLKPWEIIWGKFTSSFSTMFLMIMSSFPLLAVSFVYGGVMIYDVILLLFCYLAVALLCGSMGICFSTLFKRSTIATVVSYGVLVIIAAGTYAVNVFALSMARMNISNTYAMSVGGMADQTNSGACLYLLLLNPVATFYAMINVQTGDSQVVRSLSSWFGPHPDNFIMENWVILSIFIQLALAAIFMFIAVKAISPSKGKKIRKIK